MLSRDLARAARRFADQQSDRIADVPSVRAFIGTVTAVAGTAISLSWRGQTVTGYALASYTPAAGDRVLCLLVDSQVVVIDQIAA